MNDSMSLGIHRLWKDDFVASMLPRLPPSVHRNPVRNGAAVPDGEAPAPEPFKCLDVAGGTGDIALRLLDRARDKFGSRDIEVEVVDLTEGMLHEGRKRVAHTMYYNSELCSMMSSADAQRRRSLSRTVTHRPCPSTSRTTRSTCTRSRSASATAPTSPSSCRRRTVC